MFGILCTLICERVLDGLRDDRVANSILAGVLLVGTVATALIKADYRSDLWNLQFARNLHGDTSGR